MVKGAGIDRRGFFLGSAAVTLDAILTRVVSAQVPQQIVQGLSLTGSPITNAHEIISRLAFPSETVEDLAGINDGTHPWDDLLGRISYSLNSFYIYSPRYVPFFHTRIYANPRDLIPLRDYRHPEVLRVRTFNIDYEGLGNVALIWDSFCRIHAIKIVNSSTFKYLGDFTNSIESFFGVWPSKIISVNDEADGRRSDKKLYLEGIDGAVTEFKWEQVISDFENGRKATPSNKGVDLESRFQLDPRLYHVETIAALNPNGNQIHDFYALATRIDRIPSSVAANIITHNQDVRVNASNHIVGRTTRWEEPVNIYYQSTKANKELVKNAARYYNLRTGIKIRLIDLDKEATDIRVGFEVGVGRDWLDPYEYRGDYNARGSIDGVFANNRAKSGRVVLSPEVASADADLPLAIYSVRRAFGQALGYLRSGNDGGVLGTGYGTPSLMFYDATQLQSATLKWLYRIPHGTTVNADGTLRQIR